MRKRYGMKRLCLLLIMGLIIRGVIDKEEKRIVFASSSLNEQIAQYEESLQDEESTFIPYSETIKQLEADNEVEEVASQPTNTPTSTKLVGVSHNNISKVGQDLGNLLKNIVREVLRTVVRLSDQLISE